MSIDEKLAEYRARRAREFAELQTKDTRQGSETIATLPATGRPQSTVSHLAAKVLHYVGKLVLRIFTFLLHSLRLLIVLIGSFTSKYYNNAIMLLYESRPGRLSYDYMVKPLQDSRVGYAFLSASLAVKLAVWSLGWAAFIYAEFGAVYIILSLLFLIYFNTRTGTEKDLGPSAYSVFNAGCERLDGTFTAEQFEKELRYGPSSVH